LTALIIIISTSLLRKKTAQSTYRKHRKNVE